MCLYLIQQSEKVPAPQVAKEDITVYKIIDSKNKSLVKEFQYAPNKLYRLRKSLKVLDTRRLDGQSMTFYNGTHYSMLNEGFHSYSEFKIAARAPSATNKVVQFTIPKGARYYTGIDGDIVSTSIKSGDLKPIATSYDRYYK